MTLNGITAIRIEWAQSDFHVEKPGWKTPLFSVHDAILYAAKFVELNSKNNAGLQECNRGFEAPPATCEKFDTHTHTHAHTRTSRPMNR